MYTLIYASYNITKITRRKHTRILQILGPIVLQLYGYAYAVPKS